MLHLKNVKIEGNLAQADFIPEQEQVYGHIVVEVASGAIQQLTNVPGFETMYPRHAAQALCRMAKQNDSRTERVVMWY